MSTGGRGVWNRKTRVDEARSIDILDLQHKGVFDKGSGLNWTLSWIRNGATVGSISYWLETDDRGPTGLLFMYTTTNTETGEKKEYSYVIPVVSTRCNYGGERWWFLCPQVVDGCTCQRRCRIVYMSLGTKYFGCRECNRLTYESRQRHREKFYEGFQKPYQVVEAAQQELAKARTWEKKEKIWRKVSRAQAAIKSLDDLFTNSKPKVTLKEK